MRRAVLLAVIVAASGCATIRAAASSRWVQQKAGRLAECAVAGIASKEAALECLGRFAEDRGTSVCDSASQWVEGVAP